MGVIPSDKEDSFPLVNQKYSSDLSKQCSPAQTPGASKSEISLKKSDNPPVSKVTPAISPAISTKDVPATSNGGVRPNHSGILKRGFLSQGRKIDDSPATSSTATSTENNQHSNGKSEGTPAMPFAYRISKDSASAYRSLQRDEVKKSVPVDVELEHRKQTGQFRGSPQTFAEAVNGIRLPSHIPDSPILNAESPRLGCVHHHEDGPTLVFSDDEIEKLSEPMRFSLIGKFSFGKPSLQSLRQYFSSQGIGPFKILQLNPKHVLVELTSDDDLTKLWLKREVYVEGFPMRLFKWSPTFDFESESSIVPIWVRLEKLPLHLLDKGALFSICAMFGKPVKVDEATRLRARPAFARVCVEIDLLGKLPERVRISQKGQTFYVNVIFEKLPKYCKFCRHVGHEEDVCYIKGPHPRPHRKMGVQNEYRNKGKAPVSSQKNEETDFGPKLGDPLPNRAGPSGTHKEKSDLGNPGHQKLKNSLATVAENVDKVSKQRTHFANGSNTKAKAKSNSFAALSTLDLDELLGGNEDEKLDNLGKLALAPFLDESEFTEDISPMAEVPWAMIPFAQPFPHYSSESEQEFRASFDVRSFPEDECEKDYDYMEYKVESLPISPIASRLTRGRLKKKGKALPLPKVKNNKLSSKRGGRGKEKQ